MKGLGCGVWGEPGEGDFEGFGVWGGPGEGDFEGFGVWGEGSEVGGLVDIFC